jgi:hypothetical protein
MEDKNTNFVQRSFTVSIPAAQGLTEYEIKFKYDVKLIRAKYLDLPSNAGDILNVDINPNKIVGINIIPCTPSQTIIYVSPTVIQNLQVGFDVSITNGVTVDDLGQCLEIKGDYIIVENQLINSYSIGAYIRLTVPLVRDLSFSGASSERVIEGTTKTSLLPKGVPILLKYDNLTGTEAKFVFDLEVLF